MDKLPIELINIIKDFIIYKPKTNIELRIPVDIWCYCNDIALQKYGILKLGHKFNNKYFKIIY